MEKLNLKPRKFSDTGEVLDALEDFQEAINALIDEQQKIMELLNERKAKKSENGFLF